MKGLKCYKNNRIVDTCEKIKSLIGKAVLARVPKDSGWLPYRIACKDDDSKDIRIVGYIEVKILAVEKWEDGSLDIKMSPATNDVYIEDCYQGDRHSTFCVNYGPEEAPDTRPLFTDEERLPEAYRHSLRNREEIERSERCGCFACVHEFDANEVGEWTDNGQTAICPCCGVDAVIGDASGMSLSPMFLREMNEKYF